VKLRLLVLVFALAVILKPSEANGPGNCMKPVPVEPPNDYIINGNNNGSIYVASDKRTYHVKCMWYQTLESQFDNEVTGYLPELPKLILSPCSYTPPCDL
jgi:hypothetical protein